MAGGWGVVADGAGEVVDGGLVGQPVFGQRLLQVGGAHGEPGDVLAEAGWATEIGLVVIGRAEGGVGQVYGDGPVGATEEQAQDPQGAPRESSMAWACGGGGVRRYSNSKRLRSGSRCAVTRALIDGL